VAIAFSIDDSAFEIIKLFTACIYKIYLTPYSVVRRESNK